jgi:hypothetical protein
VQGKSVRRRGKVGFILRSRIETVGEQDRKLIHGFFPVVRRATPLGSNIS